MPEKIPRSLTLNKTPRPGISTHMTRRIRFLIISSTAVLRSSRVWKVLPVAFLTSALASNSGSYLTRASICCSVLKCFCAQLLGLVFHCATNTIKENIMIINMMRRTRSADERNRSTYWFSSHSLSFIAGEIGSFARLMQLVQ